MNAKLTSFWQRLERSGLLANDPLRDAHRDYEAWSTKRAESGESAAEAATGPQQLASWLVGRRLLSDYQARLLLDGGEGPFQLGPLRLIGQVDDWGLPDHLLAAWRPTGDARPRSAVSSLEPGVMLGFGNGLGPQDWAAVQARVRQLNEPSGGNCSHLLLPWATFQCPPYCGVLQPTCLLPGDENQATDENSGKNAAKNSGQNSGDSWRMGAQTLAQRLAPEAVRRRGPLSLKRSLLLAADVAAAVAELHQRGLVHGLINPAAVLRSADKRGVLLALPGLPLRIAGLATQLGWDPQRSMDATGSADQSECRRALCTELDPDFRFAWCPADFLSPEQLASLAGGSAASDRYALGAMLLFLLTGRPPGKGGDWKSRRSAGAPTDDWQLPAETPPPIRSLLESLLVAAPADRPPKTGTIAATLYQMVKARPITDQPLFPPTKSARSIRKWAERLPDLAYFSQRDRSTSSSAGTAAGRERSRSGSGEESAPALRRRSAAGPPEAPLAAPVLRVSPDRLPSIQNPDGSGRRQSSGAGRVAEPDGGAPGFVIKDQESKVSLRKLRQQRKKGTFWSPPVISCFISGACALILVTWWLLAMAGRGAPDMAADPNDGDPRAGADQSAVGEGEAPPATTRLTGWNQQVVEDDGRLLWESPTVGLPVDLVGLPDNPNALLVIQRDFWRIPTLEPLLRALNGPAGDDSARILEWQEQFSAGDFQQAMWAQYQTPSGVTHAWKLESRQPVAMNLSGWQLVARLTLPPEALEASDSAYDQPDDSESTPDGRDGSAAVDSRAAIGGAQVGPREDWILSRRGSAGQTEVAWAVVVGDDSEFAADLPTAVWERVESDMFDPDMAQQRLGDQPLRIQRLMVTGPELMKDTIRSAGQTEVTVPMATLVGYSDHQRQLQLIVNPVTLWNQTGLDWLGARWGWVGALMKDHAHASVRMMYLSVHVLDGGETYVEMKVAADRSQPASTVLAPLLDDLQQAPQMVKRSLLDLPRVSYWESALLRYDDMLQDVLSSIRAGQHDRLPTMNAWLRPRAMDNLLAATDIYFTAQRLAKGQSPAMATGSGAAAAGETPQNLEQLLALPRNLNIPQQDLINALADLETEIRLTFPNLPFEFGIDLDGNALRLEGITQNQSVSDFQMVQAPLSEILSALVLKANPDPAVTSPKDPGCKLIWLADPGREGRLRITTRAAANQQGWTLPPEVSLD